MDTSVLGVIVKVPEPDMLPDMAEIVVMPIPTAVAFPLVPAMVATDTAEELQVTDDVRFWVLLSEKIPVAVNCSLAPRAMEGFEGVRDMDTSVALLTVSTLDPDMLPDVAEIAVVPAAIEVANPLAPAALLTTATAGTADCHVTEDVIFCVLLSEKMAVAVNC